MQEKTNSIRNLLEYIETIKQSEIRELIAARLKEFEETGQKSSSEIFKELCFCILTANFNAERSIKIQMDVGDEFLTLSEARLSEKLRSLGYRFPHTRAAYIIEARKHKDSLKDILESFKDSGEAREWLAENLRGIGYKEASHFLRNIGYKDLAIIDFHIISVLAKHGLINKVETLNRKRYLEIERLLKEIAERINLNLAELDLYLWYIETGKVLK